jgi:hypothetical protein
MPQHGLSLASILPCELSVHAVHGHAVSPVLCAVLGYVNEEERQARLDPERHRVVLAEPGSVKDWPHYVTGIDDAIAQSTSGLVRDTRLQNFLILRCQRRLLSSSPGLGLVVKRLGGKLNGNPRPRALPIGVPGSSSRLSVGDRHHQCGSQR